MRFGLCASLLSLRQPRTQSPRSIHTCCWSSKQCSAFSTRACLMQSHPYRCSVEAEPLHRYRPGGYHPVHLGDILKNGRYKILHKLGYGSYSTVWVARDRLSQCYVALKILVASTLEASRELRTLRTLQELPPMPGMQNIQRLIDDFQHTGPNGSHNCLVLELLGSNIPTAIATHFSDGRLPGNIAKKVSMQVISGLNFLHKNHIGHGDLHTGNIVFEIPSLHSLSEEALIAKLSIPETSPALRSDGKGGGLGAEVPRYLVWPTSFSAYTPTAHDNVKIIDLGESFRTNDRPTTLHTPLVVRAPEVIFGDHWDYRVDLWSAGCMVFELVTGQPPFDSLLGDRKLLISQMVESIGELLDKWQIQGKTVPIEELQQDEHYDLQAWLEELYFDTSKSTDMSLNEINEVGALLRKLLRFSPQTRVSAGEVLEEEWYKGIGESILWHDQLQIS